MLDRESLLLNRYIVTNIAKLLKEEGIKVSIISCGQPDQSSFKSLKIEHESLINHDMYYR